MRTTLVILALLCGCHDVETDLEHDDLREEMFHTAATYKTAMCACKTTECATELDGRFQTWLKQLAAKVEDSDRRRSYSVMITEDGKKRFDALIDGYTSCMTDLHVRAAIHR
jgi:hypothetical protein